jgi:hypothetical protein
MKKLQTDDYPGFAPLRRRRNGFFLSALLLCVGLICFVLCLGPVLLAMAVVSALASLSASFASFVAAALSLMALVPLLELLSLLLTGQPVQFVMRLVQIFGN